MHLQGYHSPYSVQSICAAHIVYKLDLEATALPLTDCTA